MLPSTVSAILAAVIITVAFMNISLRFLVLPKVAIGFVSGSSVVIYDIAVMTILSIILRRMQCHKTVVGSDDSK
jgi:hypothetical protein